MIYKAIDRWNSLSLAHYGVKGMKWGVRHDRVSSSSGRYILSLNKRNTSATKAIDNNASQYKTSVEKIKAVTSDCMSKNYGSNKLSVRERKAADLGLKALNKMGRDVSKNITDSDRYWFNYEDQTIGMPIIADLVNQGYTSKQCSKLLNIVKRNYNYNDKYDKSTENVIFELTEGHDLDKFSKYCEAIKNSRR